MQVSTQYSSTKFDYVQTCKKSQRLIFDYSTIAKNLGSNNLRWYP